MFTLPHLNWVIITPVSLQRPWFLRTCVNISVNSFYHTENTFPSVAANAVVTSSTVESCLFAYDG